MVQDCTLVVIHCHMPVMACHVTTYICLMMWQVNLCGSTNSKGFHGLILDEEKDLGNVKNTLDATKSLTLQMCPLNSLFSSFLSKRHGLPFFSSLWMNGTLISSCNWPYYFLFFPTFLTFTWELLEFKKNYRFEDWGFIRISSSRMLPQAECYSCLFDDPYSIAVCGSESQDVPHGTILFSMKCYSLQKLHHRQ